MWKVLIVDDSEKYAQSQIELAGNMGINLIHIDNWEDAQSYLEKSGDDVNCTIIDGKGKLKLDGKEEDLKHLTKALGWFREQKGRGLYCYYVINTAFADEINNLIEDEPVYGKFGGEKKMFQDIIENIQNEGVQKIKIKYANIFSVFENGFLDSKTENQLIKAIRDCEVQKKELIEGILTNIRGVQEAIFNSLQSPNIGIIPSSLSRFNEKNIHLSGNPKKDIATNKPNPTTDVYQNSAISSINNNIYWVSGQYIHTLPGETYFISIYTANALLFSLFELLLWYKSIALKYYKK